MGFGGFRTISLFPGGRMGPVRVASFRPQGAQRASQRASKSSRRQAGSQGLCLSGRASGSFEPM